MSTITLDHLLRVFAVSALLLLLIPGATAVAAEKTIWGPTTLPDGRSAFPIYEELGVDTLQSILNWSQVAPTRPASPTDPSDPAYRWPAELTAAAGEADRVGIRLALQLTESPAWANGGKSPIWAPQSAGDFADFATAAARRYPQVRRWMIWGEPNKADRFQPTKVNDPIGPRAYAPLLDAAYGALKQVSSANVVIGGMTWTGGEVRPPDFVRFMRLSDGRRPRLDWFGHNPFPFRFPKLSARPIGLGFRDISDSDTFSREIARAYGRRVPLWLSEYTIQSDKSSATFATFVSRAAQARYVTAGWKLADDLAGAVAGIGWFALLDEPAADQSANWGLLSSTLQRKPAFDAYARAPGERLRPAVSVASSLSRATLRRQGLTVRVTPRASGSIVVELRRSGRVRARSRARAAAGARRTLRLRSSLPAGRYTLGVRAARAATVRRLFRVR